MFCYACHGALSLLTLLLLSGAEPAADTQFCYNLNGDKIMCPLRQEHTTKKIIVLTSSTDPTVIAERYNAHMTIDLPSTAVLDSMQIAYDQTSKDGNERLFMVGIAGRISSIVEGSDTAVNPAPAGQDLRENRHDTSAYRVHTHKQYPRPGQYGSFIPSEADRDRKNFMGKTQASIILGYDQSGTQIMGFYYISSETEKIKFSDFILRFKTIASEN